MSQNKGLTSVTSKVPYDTEWTDVYGDYCRARIVNGIVFVRGVSFGEVSIGGGNNFKALTTLPARFRPNGSWYFPVGWNGGLLNLHIGTDGRVEFAGTATTSWNFFISYPANI